MSDEPKPEKVLKPQIFKYRKPPPEQQSAREVVRLCRIPGLQGSVHVVRKGGGEHLHSHASVDGFWMVLSGRVGFYGDEGVSYGEFGPGEGILMPRGNRYWFEAIGEGDAELIQVLHIDKTSGFHRRDHEPAKVNSEDINLIIKGRVIPPLNK